MEEANAKDALANFRTYLLEHEVTDDEVSGIEKAMFDEIEKAFEFAQNSPYPDVSIVTDHMFTMDNERCVVR